MERKVFKYIVNFFLYLLIGFLLLGLFIKIEYKNKTGKDVIGMFPSAFEIFRQGVDRDYELANVSTIGEALFARQKYGGDERNLIPLSMAMHKAFNAGTAEFNRNVDVFAALDKDDLYQREMQDVRRRFNGTNIGPKTMEFLIKSGLEGYSEEEMVKGVKEINPDIPDENILNFVKHFKPYMDKDVRDYTANRVSALLDRGYEDKLALLNKISEDYIETLKGTDEGKSIKKANGIFELFKGKSAKERALISSVINTLSLDDLKGLTKDRGPQGYNEFMNFLSNLGDSINSTTEAINDHSAMFASVSSNIGGSFLESVINQHKGDDGLYKVISNNPNMHNIGRENIVYDSNGNPTFLYKSAVDIRKMRDFIQKYSELERVLEGVRASNPGMNFDNK